MARHNINDNEGVSELPIAKVHVHRADRKPDGVITGMRITKHDGSTMEMHKIEKIPSEIIERTRTMGDVQYLRYIETDTHFALSNNVATEEEFNQLREREENSPTALMLDIFRVMAAEQELKLDTFRAAIRIMQKMRMANREMDDDGLVRGIRVIEQERQVLKYAASISDQMKDMKPDINYLRKLVAEQNKE
jgi:hypothetical protein